MTATSKNEDTIIDLIQTHHNTHKEWPRLVDIVRHSPFGVRLTEDLLDALRRKGIVWRDSEPRADTTVEVYHLSPLHREGPITPADVDELREAVEVHGGRPRETNDHLLIPSPCFSNQVICGLVPIPHLQSGEMTLVCTGPIVWKGDLPDGDLEECPWSAQQLEPSTSESSPGWLTES